MKNLTLNLLAIILVSLLWTSCKKEDNNTPDTPSVVKLPTDISLILKSGNTYTYDIKYDSDKRISRITTNGGDYYQVNYDGAKLDDVLFYDASASDLSVLYNYIYDGNTLDSIYYSNLSAKYKVLYNPATATYTLRTGTDNYDYVFNNSDLLRYTFWFGPVEISVKPNDKKGAFYDMKRTDEIMLFLNHAPLGLNLMFMNQYSIDEMTIASDMYKYNASYDSDGYPTKYEVKKGTSDYGEIFITY